MENVPKSKIKTKKTRRKLIPEKKQLKKPQRSKIKEYQYKLLNALK